MAEAAGSSGATRLAFDKTPELLGIQAVRSTKEKVDRVEFHPVQPWLAFVDRNSTVTVWNYESDELLYDAQLGGADEAALQEAALRQRADRGAAAAGLSATAVAAQEASLAAKGTASGLVRDVKFLDMDTCFWQIARQHWLQYGAFDDHTIPYLGRYKGLQGKRWLVIACENKVVMHDLASADSRDIPRSACFESKAPTALAFLLLNLPGLSGYGQAGGQGAARMQPELMPVMAVGTSGGSIFLINPDTMTLYAKLSGAHGKSVTAMLPLSSEAPGGPDMLLTASADGTIAVWDPSRSAVRGADREMSAKHAFKAHDNGVAAMTYFLAYTEKPDPPVLRLATTGEDKRVHMWEVGSWKPFAKAQPLQKATCHSIGWAPWGGTGLGAHPSLLLATGEAPLVLGLDPATGGMERYAGLEGKIEPGQKKMPKVYHLAVHPTRPHLVAAATNTGAVLLSFDTNERPPVVALPAQVVTLEALLQQNSTPDKRVSDAGGKGAQGLTYVTASGGKLWSTALRMESQRAEGAAERTVSLAAGQREAIAKLDHAGRPVLACSASGRSISAVWPQLRAYAVYCLAPTGTWEVVDRGSGNNVVWSSTSPMYAVISVPNIPTAVSKKKKGFFGGGGGKKAAQQQQEEEAAAEAARAAAASTTVEVHVVNEEAGSQFVATHEVRLAGEQPVLLHGGGLLGVVLNKPGPGATGRALQFVSWKGFAAVGPELAEPVWVSWEPECTLLALAYEHTIELCRTRPAFERFASISIADSVAGLWQSRQLYISTPTSVHVAFADPVTAFVQEVQLASFQGGVDSKTSPAAEATPLPPEQMRPAGPITLAGVRHSYLWLADCLGRPFLLSLRHPGLRLRCLAARGEITTARTIAERGLSAGFHDDVARFLAAMSPQEGVREALALHGLTPPAEMALSIRSGAWDRAARCFQALALGVSDKALLQLFADGGGGASPLDASRLTGLSLSAEGATHAATVAAMLEAHAKDPSASFAEGLGSPAAAAADGGNDDSSDDEAAAAEEAAAAAAQDPVDWEAPLPPGGAGTIASVAAAEAAAAAPWEGEAAGGAGGGAGPTGAAAAAGSGAFVGAAERQRLASVAELGLRFAEAAAEAGHDDAARSALGVLVRSAHLLPPALAEQLVFSMGQCRMTESARILAGAVASSKGAGSLSDPAVSSLLAALVGGMHGPAVQGTLQAAGLAPQAAVYSAVWGNGDREAAVAEWRRQLAAAHPEAAATVAVVPPVA